MVASAGQTRVWPGSPPGIRARATAGMAAIRSRGSATGTAQGGDA